MAEMATIFFYYDPDDATSPEVNVNDDSCISLRFYDGHGELVVFDTTGKNQSEIAAAICDYGRACVRYEDGQRDIPGADR